MIKKICKFPIKIAIGCFDLMAKLTSCFRKHRTDNTALIKKIHESPIKIAIAIAGGGSEVIGELLRHGKGSNTILDASVPYCQKAFEKYIGGTPDKFVSEDAACSLATAAYKKAIELDDSEIPKLGIGATISLVKDHERAGREHKAFIAFHEKEKTHTYYLELNKERTREEEETLISDFIINSLAVELKITNDLFCGNESDNVISNIYSKQHNSDSLATCVSNEKKSPDNLLIMPGSFNVIHEGHIKMAEVASGMMGGKKVDFEICIHNADKPPLSHKSINSRVQDFYNHKNHEFIGDLWLTKLPLFIDKACLFNHATFILGYDTIERIFDRKYYATDHHFASILTTFKSSKWIIFPRIKKDGNVCTEEEIDNIVSLYNLEALRIPHDVYESMKIMNLSSSSIRKEKLNG